MKALTISQPFASLIADGAKWVETGHGGDTMTPDLRQLLEDVAGELERVRERREAAYQRVKGREAAKNSSWLWGPEARQMRERIADICGLLHRLQMELDAANRRPMEAALLIRAEQQHATDMVGEAERDLKRTRDHYHRMVYEAEVWLHDCRHRLAEANEKAEGSETTEAPR